MKGSSLVDRYQESPNFEMRAEGKSPQLLILHYTGMATGQAAVNWLCNPESRVSCHYLVDVDGKIVQIVDEEYRAWHAGTSSWQGEIDINSTSIGIEIQNIGHSAGCPVFPDVQMQRVAELSLDIMQRHGLSPHHVLGHSDVAPGRKIDPGEAFDWKFLAQQGIGQMISAPAEATSIASVADVQTLLNALGYGMTSTQESIDRTRIVIEAVQRRYRSLRVDGKIDGETTDIVRRLLASLPNH